MKTRLITVPISCGKVGEQERTRKEKEKNEEMMKYIVKVQMKKTRCLRRRITNGYYAGRGYVEAANFGYKPETRHGRKILIFDLRFTVWKEN
jgi:hypothetical protein